MIPHLFAEGDTVTFITKLTFQFPMGRFDSEFIESPRRLLLAQPLLIGKAGTV